MKALTCVWTTEIFSAYLFHVAYFLWWNDIGIEFKCATEKNGIDELNKEENK